jgi:hypothetical protein
MRVARRSADCMAGESESAGLRVDLDPRPKLEFHGPKVASDAGLLAFRDLDDTFGLTARPVTRRSFG